MKHFSFCDSFVDRSLARSSVNDTVGSSFNAPFRGRCFWLGFVSFLFLCLTSDSVQLKPRPLIVASRKEAPQATSQSRDLPGIVYVNLTCTMSYLDFSRHRYLFQRSSRSFEEHATFLPSAVFLYFRLFIWEVCTVIRGGSNDRGATPIFLTASFRPLRASGSVPYSSEYR